MITLDGSYLEGGGSLVRVALALSTLTGEAFQVKNIRSGRKEPGLKAQHLTAIQALKEMSGAKTNDIALGSLELDFAPAAIRSGKYTFDIGTAGSISLFLQAIILPCLFSPGKVTLTVKGGTCGKWQASADYLQNVLVPQVRRFAEKIELKIRKRGYYPQGGGEVVVEISPRFHRKDFADTAAFLDELQKNVAKIKLVEQGKLEQIRGIVNVSASLAEKKVGERIRDTATAALQRYAVPLSLRLEYAETLSPGGDVVLWAVFSKEGDVSPINPIILGSNALAEREKRSEDVGKEAADALAKEIDAEVAVDHYLADQLLPFMALLPGSAIQAGSISNHAKTNIYVVEKFLPVHFMVERNTIQAEKLVEKL